MKEKKKIEFSFMKNKVVVGIGSIVLGLLVSFVLTPLYNQSLKKKVDVVQVAKRVEEGQKITEDMVKIVKIGNFNLADNIVTRKDEVIGKYAKTDLFQQQYMIKECLSEKPLSQDEYLENLDGTKGAISVTLQTFASGLSGKIFPNDLVSIIATDETGSYIPPELKYVKVLACTLDNGSDVDENTKSEMEEDTDVIADTVTLLVSDEQAKVLASLEKKQNIHVELIYRGSEKIRNKYLKQQDKILRDKEANESGE